MTRLNFNTLINTFIKNFTLLIYHNLIIDTTRVGISQYHVTQKCHIESISLCDQQNIMHGSQRLLDNVLLLLLQNSKTRISEFRLSPTGWTTFETEGTHKSVWNTRQLLKHEAELKKAFLIILNSKSSPTVLDPLLAIRHHRHLNPGILSRSLPTTIRCTFSGDTCHVSLVSTFQS